MTTKNTIFKLKDGYILLEDLESWYSDGLVTLEDPIQVYEDGGRRMGCYSIRDLIEIYGVEFPFRRVPQKLISAPDPSSRIPLLSSNPGIILDRTKIYHLKRLFIYVNPRELKNEEFAWSKIVNSVEIPDRCPGCRKPIPKEPYRLARHILSYPHLSELEEVSEEDYEFWMDILGRDAVFKSKAPLLSFPDINGEQCSKEEFKLAMKEMNEAMKKFGNRFNEKPVNWICEYCSTPYSHPSPKTDVKAFKHIIGKHHAKKMNYTAPLEELNFWKNWLNEQIPMINENLSETQKMRDKVGVFSTSAISIPYYSLEPPVIEVKAPKISKPQTAVQNNNVMFQTIPLLLSYSGPNFDRTKIDNLTKLYFDTDKSALESEEGYWAKFLKSVKIPVSFPEFCGKMHTLQQRAAAKKTGEQDGVRATESIRKGDPVNEDTQADKVVDKSKTELVEKIPEAKKPLEVVPDALKTSDKEVPTTKKASVVDNATPEKKNLPKTVPNVKNSSEPSKDVTNNSKKPGPSTVTQKAIETAPVIPPQTPTTPGNEPRVPLLDPMLAKETSATKENFNKALDKCLDLYKKDRSRFDEGKKALVTWTCTFCSTPSRKVAMSNRTDTLLHIVKPEHREKMQFQASADDLSYWMKYVLGISKDAEKALNGKQKHNAKNEVFKKPANNPRIPLLDVPASQGKLMTQDAFKARYNRICEQLHMVKETYQKLECVCYHCPGKPRFTSVNDLMQHVFDGEHCENIMFSATSSDFDYYEDLMKKMIPVPKKEAAKKTPVSIVNPTPKLSENLIECNLPLFLTQQKMARRTDETCIGPTNSQIVYIGRLVQNPQMAPIRFRDNVKCGICNVDISSWEAIKVTRHVFSTEHLYALKQTGTNFYIADFEFWILRLVQDNTLLYPPHFLGTTLPVVCSLGGLKYMDCNVNSEVFKKFSSQELIMINNLDEQKVHSRAESLLRTFGGCLYCKKWLVSGIEVIQHYTSEEHFEMVRKKHPVNMIHVNIIMSYVKQCQKGVEVKPAPIKSAPVSGGSVAQVEDSARQTRGATIGAIFKDFSFPLFVTKKDMKPRTDEICVGPPNAYVDFVMTTRPEDPGMVWPFMKENTKCKICNLVIPGTSILDAALHAFSVEHLYNLHKTGTNFYEEDFEWWTTQLYNEPAFVHNPTSLSVICRMGGFDIPKLYNKAENPTVVYGFTREEQELINRVDEDMVKNHSAFLLEIFGSCIYCNKWLLTGMEAIKHYTSNEHFRMIRQKHPVVQAFIDVIMIMVQECQKSNRRTLAQEPSVNLGEFDYLKNYDEYDNPFYKTKEKLGSRNGTVCSGPPNSHIDFLRKAKPRNESLLPKATDKWKKCGICNIPMSHWNILQTIEHAYTVDHLYKRQITGTPLYSEDFEDMMLHLRIQLGSIGHECSSNCTTLTHLDGLRPMSSDSSSVFLEFTPEENAMLENLDQKKVESQALSLLQNFGGCIYCNQWFVSGKEVIEHFTSESHFWNIRKKEPVRRSYVNCMMEYVKRCQKDPSSCSVM